MGIVDTVITGVIQPESPGDNHSLLDWEFERLESHRVPPTSRTIPIRHSLIFHSCPVGKTIQETIERQTHASQCIGLSTPGEYYTQFRKRKDPQGFAAVKLECQLSVAKGEGTWSVRGDFVFKKLTPVLTHRDAFCSHHLFQ